jgi:hypothetical protein
VDTIGAARAAFDDALVTPSWADRPAIMQAADAYAMAVLDEIEGAALATADIAVNEFFVEDAIVPLRAQINALGGPRPHGGHAEPPQQEEGA